MSAITSRDSGFGRFLSGLLMDASDEARKYLDAELKRRRVRYIDASLLLGKNHAYIQQYISGRTPRWLPERVRETLVATYGLDANKLREPMGGISSNDAAASGSHGDDKPQIDTPSAGQIVDDPRTLQLLRYWANVPEGHRDLVLRILRDFARNGSSIVA